MEITPATCQESDRTSNLPQSKPNAQSACPWDGPNAQSSRPAGRGGRLLLLSRAHGPAAMIMGQERCHMRRF